MGDRHAHPGKESPGKPERMYKPEQSVGVSEVSAEDAIRNAIARAHQTLEGLDWFQVVETRGTIADGKVA